MSKRIDFFVHQNEELPELDEFTLQLSQGLKRQGAHVEIHAFESKDPEKFLVSVMADRPDMTLSFSGVMPDSEGNFLSDLLNIPHLSCLVQAPTWFIALKHGPLNWITCLDRSHVAFFKGLGFTRADFMTGAAEESLLKEPCPKVEKIYEVVLFGPCQDLESIEAHWQATYSERMLRALHHATDIALRDPKTAFWQAFSEAVNIHAPKDQLDLKVLIELLQDLERFIVGKDQIDFIRHSKKLTFDIFGNEADKISWQHYLKDHPNVRLHPPCEFAELPTIMSQSKMVFYSAAALREGASSNLFKTYAMGTVPISSESPFLAETFEDRKSIIFTRWGSWHANEDKIEGILRDKGAYQSILDQGRTITLRHHTWDIRAKEIFPFISQIK